MALYGTTHDHTVHFNQSERGTSDRIRYQRVDERAGDEVEYSDVVKVHDYSQKSCWLDPAKSEYARPYRLLVRAMAKPARRA